MKTLISFLVVDDTIDLLDAVAFELAAVEGCGEIYKASNGEEAMQILAKKSVSIIISDVRMPICSGMELLDQVRQKFGPMLPFIFMSGFADAPLWEAYARGVDGWLGKPFSNRELVPFLKRLLVPMDMRWLEQEKGKAEIQIAANDFANCVALGRGGVFIADGDGSLAKGDVINFKLQKPQGPVISGAGRILWHRVGDPSGLPDGYGIEFLYLPKSCRSFVLTEIAAKQPLAYIPRSL